MSIINYYNNPTIIDWHVDENGQPISLLIQNETKQVVDGKIPLEGIPDEQYRIQITGMVEVNIKDKIDASNKFKCSYTHGLLYVDQSLNGTNITITRYYSRGVIFYPSSRIWHKLSVDGKVSQTLDDAFNIIDSELIQKAHIHEHKAVLDKFSEVDGKVVYNGKAIGGATLDTVQPTDGSTWLKVIG